MKNILFALLLITLSAKAQSDSAKITVTIQARDCEYIGSFVAFHPDFEDLFDAMKLKFRVSSPPTGTTNVVIDTIYTIQWVRVSERLRDDPMAIGGAVFSRVDAALRAISNSYLTARLDALNNRDTELFTTNRTLGRLKLRRQ